MIKSIKQKPKTPEWTLAKFMECWKRRAWKQLSDYCRLSWLKQHNTPSTALRHILNSTLIDVDIVQTDANTGVMAAFILVLKLTPFNSSRILNITREVKLYREYKQWGVDPECFVKLFM